MIYKYDNGGFSIAMFDRAKKTMFKSSPVSEWLTLLECRPNFPAARPADHSRSFLESLVGQTYQDLPHYEHLFPITSIAPHLVRQVYSIGSVHFLGRAQFWGDILVLGGELPTNRGCGLVHPSYNWDFCRVSPLKKLGWTNPQPRFVGSSPPSMIRGWDNFCDEHINPMSPGGAFCLLMHSWQTIPMSYPPFCQVWRWNSMKFLRLVAEMTFPCYFHVLLIHTYLLVNIHIAIEDGHIYSGFSH